jgi:Flp pilus assembly protein protease CpaA
MTVAAGWPFAATVMLYVSIAGGAQALLWLAFAKLSGKERPRRIPYGLAIAAGTLAAFTFGGAVF